MNNLFKRVLTNAIESADLITTQKDKAIAYAEIASIS